MDRPFNMPDEFVDAFAKAGASLWRSLGWPTNDERNGAMINPSLASSGRIAELQVEYLKGLYQLSEHLVASAMDGKGNGGIEPVRGDRRFSGTEWRENSLYSLLKQSYLLNSRYCSDLVEALDMEEKEKHRLRFFTRQLIEAMSPTNCIATNPEVIKLAADTDGQSLKTGLDNLMADLGKGNLTITDETAFEVGRDVATSKGAVVFENELLQLIQYEPATEQVAARPLLIVPPCINKFYILDLQPSNSFVRFAVEHGLTVFMVSWRNPDASCGHFGWDDYVEHGAMRAIEIAQSISGSDKINVVGWCVGGTILSSALAIMRTRGDESVASVTLLTTMLDFREPGDLGVFVDEESVRQRELTIGNGGIYRGAELGFVFQTLRSKELIWPNVINHYLKGKPPERFDLLFWNADVTNLPGPMYCWYMRNMYLENNLRVPGKLTICGTPVDLGRVDLPAYVLATVEDHIVPWRSAYRTTGLFKGDTRFVLGASGHIAGVINPASKNKRSYWVSDQRCDEPATWLAGADEKPGSWWNDWIAWLEPRSGEQLPARTQLGNNLYPPGESAPGRYVKAKAD
ncbi:class I poly(R)-hydroxyalkanoic acid synthase [Bradyrhizobium yuanmingense]|uniref:class I poly(R)-hydroxyalkanoic acid synthase n=1 Tax=Bradyrhizobium yuanmingense TaxID=108015 RepID=UPI000FE3B16E|nr:class I poly(R)-hydroxyalkanoic acid synthase [Bradyrhizobium yuanmingense]TGN89952.1 class I poly(R)-hydroxyalkanoic acid synthase [Bradyrhizobium yuanmingense]